MSIFNKKKIGGVADVIRCDEDNYLVWKWHPNAYNTGDLKRETSLRTNSVLKVKTGEVAVFVYKQKNGNVEDYIVGPYDGTIKTKNFPVLSSIIGLWYEGDTPFQAEVYFINVANATQIKFGIPYFNVVDPRFTDFEVPVAVRGTLTFKIEDYKGFVRFHQLAEFSLESLKRKINDTICRDLKKILTNEIKEEKIAIIGIESMISIFSEKAEASLKDVLLSVFGITVKRLDISAIDVDKDSESYIELKKVTKDVTSRQIEANILNYEEQLRIQREEGQYAQHMQTRQQNIGAYQTEVKGQVGVAGAEALGKMGENNAGNVDIGGASGFNPMTMMAGMALGSAIGKNVSGAFDQSINSGTNDVPPALPKIVYYYSKDNKPNGPYELNQMIDFINSGVIKRDTLVWKQGTPAWVAAEALEELSSLLPPKLP